MITVRLFFPPAFVALLALAGAVPVGAQTAARLMPNATAAAATSARAEPPATGLLTARDGAEVSMIELQSQVSKRATTLQLTTGMMQSMNSDAKLVAGNIGRGGNTKSKGHAGTTASAASQALAWGEPGSRN